MNFFLQKFKMAAMTKKIKMAAMKKKIQNGRHEFFFAKIQNGRHDKIDSPRGCTLFIVRMIESKMAASGHLEYVAVLN